MSFAAVAITTAVVGTGAAVAGGVMQSQAAGRARKQQEKAGARLKKQTQQATNKFISQQEEVRKKVNEIDPSIKIPEYNLQGATLEGIEAANKVTENTLQQLEKIAPGSAQARQKVGQIIGSYLAGEVPTDVQQQITSMTAERLGAGFAVPQAGVRGPGGFQVAQGQLARNLGLTSLDLQQAGANLAQSWQQTAASFIQSPTQMMAFGLTGRAQDINLQQQNIRNRMLQQEMISGINLGQYKAQTGQADIAYGVQQRNIEAGLGQAAADVGMIQGIGSALSGAAMGYGQMRAMQPAGVGGFGSLGQAQQAAPFAAGYSNVPGMGYVPRASAVY